MEQKKIFDQNCDFVKFSTSMFVFKCREKKYKNLKSSSRFTSPNSIILSHSYIILRGGQGGTDLPWRLVLGSGPPMAKKIVPPLRDKKD